ncbi:signal transduction histidine kinase [Aquamicrobium lusatiense]|uniref:histidine kinase n=1 Tax=Aquamicrobium lusatiense TaxID=89772 RepID=A0A7W9VVC7_9HYPH|nr:ATP-binding protein [Aquamicrobium lusatiense]MBB6011912.1 signal transduction histidine kinase [Aquamicrobium lusatiense]
MKSLRNRLVLLLIIAIVTVVGLATFAASRALQPPLPAVTIEPVARQLHLLAALAERDRQDALSIGIRLQDQPAGGIEIERMSQFLNKAMEKTGAARAVTVTQASSTSPLIASVQLDSGAWLISEVPGFGPPQSGGWVLAGWSILIVLGSTAVSIFAASKIIRPLQILEDAINRIGPDGVIPPIPETGSGEVRATAHALNSLSGRLKSAIESRMRLVAAAGHDLRTPMTRMRLRAEFVADDAEREKWLADLQELDAIADSAIRLVKEEVGSDNRETVRLGSLVQEIVDELIPLGYKVTPPSLASLPVAAGPIALKRALRNLIINAATHGGGASIQLEVEGDDAVIKIRDRGPGIPEELLDQVFEPFFRVDAARRKIMPGAGLGLAISKEIIERFRGTITIANSTKPKGLVQTVKLPLARSEERI